MLEQANSSKNQEIKRRFIEREVLTCQSHLVEELLNNGIFQLEEIENFYKDNSEEIEELEEKIDQLEFLKEELEEEQENPQDIFEWWLITPWFSNKLKEQGEPILDNDYGVWWGRTCTGQAILLDSVISQICYNMEILEGQKNQW